VTTAAPGRVLGLAVIGWGLGHLALGRRRSGVAWLAAELAMLTGTIVLSLLLIDTTWYLVPFGAGAAFIAAWAAQAVLAYRAAIGSADAAAPTPRRSPAASIAWLTLPLLVWGTGFWLIAGSAGSPEAVLDRFVTAWPRALDETDPFASLTDDPALLASAATQALDRLEELCAAGQLTSDCSVAPEALLRDVRVRLEEPIGGRATAVAEVVRYERRETRFLGLFAAAELEPVPFVSLLELELGTEPAALGAQRWTIVNAQPLSGVPVT
jgi:hypothetical protein